MQDPHYDEGHWPVLLVTMPVNELNDRELVHHIDRLSSYLERGVPCAHVIDVRRTASLGADSRRLIAERLDQDEERYPGLLRGVAIVLSTPLHRGIFKAMSWLSRTPRPLEAFSEVQAAMLWARRLVAAVPAHSMTMPIAADVTKRVG
jgi:hypothetical protein